MLSGAESGNLNRGENCRSVKLVKLLSLDKCCPGCFCQVVRGGHAFGFEVDVGSVTQGGIGDKG